MGYFIAYRHTGADPARLKELLIPVKSAFNSMGVDAYCTYFDEQYFKESAMNPRDVMKHAFEAIERLGELFVIVDTEDKSEGMLMEVGFCIAKNIPVTVAKNKKVLRSYLPLMAQRTIEYDTVQQLCEIIQEGD